MFTSAAGAGRGRAAGLLIGVLADRALGDPTRWHPVAGFGRYAAALERRLWRDRRGAGILHLAACLAPVLTLGVLAERAGHRWPAARVALTGAATWAVLGGRGLSVEAGAMSERLAAGDVAGARLRVRSLVGRDPSALGPDELARAVVESLAENTGDAVVGSLLWGAALGVPGLLGHRAVNTLDAMFGHRSPRYRRFGWAAARADDLVNLAPARLTGLLCCALAGSVGGSPRAALRVLLADAAEHPSPNGGWCEAAVAGALGVRLGGTNVYDGRVESRGILGGGGRECRPSDIARADRLTTAAGLAATALAATLVLLRGRRRRTR